MRFGRATRRSQRSSSDFSKALNDHTLSKVLYQEFQGCRRLSITSVLLAASTQAMRQNVRILNTLLLSYSAESEWQKRFRRLA
jgi:hypothetical protein